MSDTVRWYNRLAAWVWPWLCDPIQTLAIPVWQEEAEADMEALWESEQKMAAIDRPPTTTDDLLPF